MMMLMMMMGISTIMMMICKGIPIMTIMVMMLSIRFW